MVDKTSGGRRKRQMELQAHGLSRLSSPVYRPLKPGYCIGADGKHYPRHLHRKPTPREYVESIDGAITPRALMRWNRASFPTSEAARQFLDRLVDNAVLVPRQQPTGPRGGRPTRIYQ